jgi:hypothetical protein
LVADSICDWATAHRDEKYVGCEFASIFESDSYAIGVDAMRLEANSQLKIDSTFTVSALK